MNENLQRKILVYADWHKMIKPFFVGFLYTTIVRGKEIFSFDYSAEWLNHTQSIALDPALHLFPGRHYLKDEHTNFGIFLDSSPDRWGRFLMQKREAITARHKEISERKLFESDYLLGVHDQHRIGALRFKLQSHGPFLDDNHELSAPPMTSLRMLECASSQIENSNNFNNEDYENWLKMLIAPGGSLGGARPKASVVDSNNELWIAKFPSRNDEIDIGLWEKLANNLAFKCGIKVADTKVKKFSSNYHTFLSKRFDRRNVNTRLHMASAMTLLNRVDGDDATNGASYLELVEFICRNGSQAEKDLKELFQRIVFNILISNTDDHLRNHSFIFTPGFGWHLSPAYDINPNKYGDGLKLNISETDNSQDLKLAVSVSKYFRLNKVETYNVINKTQAVIKDWQIMADELKIPRSEQSFMSSAFKI